MSRLGGKAGLSREKPKVPPPSQHAVAVPDIVPGKFNENDWLAMLEKDSSEDFILDYIDEILAQTLESVHRLYVQRQVLPFTVHQAANEMLGVVEWNFLGRDEGEESIIESGWIPDEEPNIAVMDNWAQGAVPRTEVITSYLIHEEEGDVCTEEEKKKAEDVDLSGLLEVDGKVSEAVSEEKQSAVAEVESSDLQLTESKKKAKPVYSRYHKKWKPGAAPKVRELLEQPQRKSLTIEKPVSVSMSSWVTGRPSLLHSTGKAKRNPLPYSDIKVDEKGNIVSVSKLEADSLPNHRISVKYQLVEKLAEGHKAGETQHRGTTVLMQQGKQSRLEKTTDTQSAGKIVAKTRKYIPMECPPSLLESINVVPGVTVMEAGRTKKIPKRIMKVSESLDQHLKDVHPISMALRDRSNTISVSDLLDRNSPLIRPLDDSKPLPPIAPTSSSTTNCS